MKEYWFCRIFGHRFISIDRKPLSEEDNYESGHLKITSNSNHCKRCGLSKKEILEWFNKKGG